MKDETIIKESLFLSIGIKNDKEILICYQLDMKKDAHDFNEKAVIASYLRGEWKPVANQKEAIALARQAASNYLKKHVKNH